VRKLRIDGGFGFDRRWTPIFFNKAISSGQHVDLRLATDYLAFVKLTFAADVGKSQLELIDSRRETGTYNYTASAVFPRKHLSVYASHVRSNYDERLFGPASILLQPDGSTGGLPLPSQLLIPQIFSAVAADRIGAGWQPRSELRISSRFSRNKVLFSFLGGPLDRFWQWDTDVSYKFGRFTIIGGYGRTNTQSGSNERNGRRFFVRVRFPFHVL
jgi:hypothetical protein